MTFISATGEVELKALMVAKKKDAAKIKKMLRTTSAARRRDIFEMKGNFPKILVKFPHLKDVEYVSRNEYQSLGGVVTFA